MSAPVRLLASVADLDEVRAALSLPLDILDLKDPSRGALGAWPAAEIAAAVRLVAGRRTVSATTGDLPMRPDLLLEAAERTAATGVDIVKVGFFGDGDQAACAAVLGRLAEAGVRLVAVMMADRRPDFALVPRLAAAGFHGAMLDTADKAAGGLRAHLTDATLAGFVAEARPAGLLTGLAGSLREADVPALAAMGPDYLGFRGALCTGGRTGALDPARVASLRRALADAHEAAL